jgi:hypothetical protein
MHLMPYLIHSFIKNEYQYHASSSQLTKGAHFCLEQLLATYALGYQIKGQFQIKHRNWIQLHIIIAIIRHEWFTNKLTLIWKLSEHVLSFLCQKINKMNISRPNCLRWSSTSSATRHKLTQRIRASPTVHHAVLGLSVSISISNEGQVGLISLQNKATPMYPAIYSTKLHLQKIISISSRLAV